MRAFLVKGRPVVTHDSSRVKPWRQDIAASARAAGAQVCGVGPVVLIVRFWMPRPKSRRTRDLLPDRRPDLDKLVRSILDALTGIAWTDDGQVVEILASKRYATETDPPGAEVSIHV